MKTSKIKEIIEVKPHTNNYGTTHYHNLVMENGDKINIGKKTEQKVAWELTYEIVDTQQEYNKAKAVKKEDFTRSKQSNPVQDDKRQLMIVRQSSLTRAIETLSHNHSEFTSEDVIIMAQTYTEWVMS